MFYSDRDRCSLGEMGYWDEILVRWRGEGLEEDPDKAFAYDYVRRLAPVSLELEPGFGERIVEETAEHRVVQRADGALIREHRHGEGMPQWLKYPLASHRDWEDRFLPRLDPRGESRYPSDWAERVTEWNGPLLSPDLFRELMVEPYRRLTSFVRDHGIELIFVVCDGYAEALIPLWIEGGGSGIYPLESAAGPKYIDEEVARVAPLLVEGGYVAWCDHYVPPDVSLEHYRYYVKLKRDLASG
jgi:hypothetical protein